MVGGTTSGYSLMGNRHIARKPIRKMIADSTPAKIGRRMKKLEKFIELDLLCGDWITGQPLERGVTAALPASAFRDLRFGISCWFRRVRDGVLRRHRHS